MPDDSPSLTDALAGGRVRAALILLVLVAMVVLGDLATPVLVAAGLLGLLALAVLVAPDVRRRPAFNALVGAGIAVYGVAYGISQDSTVGLAVAAVIVVVGIGMAAIHLGTGFGSGHRGQV